MEDKKVWAVEKWGVYMQGIVGIFEKYGDAADALIAAKAKEPDDYHDFAVQEYIIGKHYDVF